MNGTPRYEIFISYRRDGGRDCARTIWLLLKGRGYNTFFDYDSLRSGKFNEGIFKAIDECRYFILVLSENALTRCTNEDDWVRHEIEYALSKGKEIIPVCPSGSTRGFPAEMPASFEPLRNIQVSRLDMEDLLDKSFDKIVEDRFEEQFRKGRSPAGAVPGVTNKSFNKIGLCIVGAILVAATAVTIAIVSISDSGDKKNEESTGPISVKRGTKEEALFENALHQQNECRRMMSTLKENGWSTDGAEFVKVSALLDESVNNFRKRKFAVSAERAHDGIKVLMPYLDSLAEKKLASVETTLAELDLSGDTKLRKKLELVNEILPLSLANKNVLAAKSALEDILYPRMKVTTICNGKIVPAKFTLEIPLRREAECSFCKKGKSSSEGNYCGACKNNPRWLEVCHDYTPGFSHMGGQLFMPGTKFNSTKDGLIYAQEKDVVGPISVEYTDGNKVYVGRSDKIIANWTGETNVIIVLRSPQMNTPGEVRTVPLPGGEKMEFVWCPPGEVKFEYRQPRSGPTKQGTIVVKKGFWISKCETSCKQMIGLYGSLYGMPYIDSHGSMDRPFLFWAHYACQYAKKVQEIIGGSTVVRLPTAAEWELAAHYGNFEMTAENVHDYAWIEEIKWDKDANVRSIEKLHAQGEKKKSNLGLYDVYGNAEEWTTGSIDHDLGLKDIPMIQCDKCGKSMSVRGGSISTTVTNALQILTRDYFRGRAPLDWEMLMPYRVCFLDLKLPEKWPPFAAVRLVADELPTSEELNKRLNSIQE